MVNPANLQTAEETAPSLQHKGLQAVLIASEDTLDATQKRKDLGGLVFIIHVSCHFTSQHRMNRAPPQPCSQRVKFQDKQSFFTSPHTHPSCPLHTGAFPTSADKQIRMGESQVKMTMHKNISHFTETHPISAISATPVSPQCMTITTTSLIFEAHLLLFANKFDLKEDCNLPVSMEVHPHLPG